MTGCERVLELLSDGNPHHHIELYRLGVVAHSRVSDLRKRGHTIVCWRDGDHSMYQLLSVDGLSNPGREASLPEQVHAAHHGAGDGGPSTNNSSPSGDAVTSPGVTAELALPAHALVAAEPRGDVGEGGVNDLERRASSPTQLSLLGAF